MSTANPYPTDQDDETTVPLRSWGELRSSGLLWLINTSVLHPRGFALAVSYPDGTTREQRDSGEAEPDGWLLVGDGSEPWRFTDAPDDAWTVDSCFASVEALLQSAREAS